MRIPRVRVRVPPSLLTALGMALVATVTSLCSGCQHGRAPTPASEDAGLAVVLDPVSPRARLLHQLHMPACDCDDLLAALHSKAFKAIVVDATPANLQILNANRELLHDFTSRGGWLMLWGLAPPGLEQFNRLVGVQHLLRPFAVESVYVPKCRDPLLTGLDPYDVLMYSKERSMIDLPLRASDVWNYVLDGDDIAPFCHFPKIDYWRPGSVTTPASDQYPPNMVNGIDDAWQSGFTFPIDKPQDLTWNFSFPRRETITGFSLVPDNLYRKITKIRLTFRGSTATPIELDVKPDELRRQEFSIPSIEAAGIGIEITGLTDGTATVSGIRNLWITVDRSSEFRATAVSMLSIGVLNKYPMGSGGIVVNEMNIDEGSITEVNRDKEQDILDVVLHNMIHPPAAAAMLPVTARAQDPQFLDVEAFENPRDLDDTEAIRRSICFAISHNYATIRFSPRTYVLANQILIQTPNNVCLQGALTADGTPATTFEFLEADRFTLPTYDSPLISGVRTQGFIFKY